MNRSEAIAAFLAALPAHKCGLYLTHNEHRDYYETVEQWESSTPDRREDWVSAEERARAIETNEVWRIQWYPDTPVGFYTMQASTLDALLAHATSQTH